MQKLLAALVDNLNEVNRAVNLSMSVQKLVAGLINASEDAARDREEGYLLAIQINNQLENIKTIANPPPAKLVWPVWHP